ncbi:MAG: chemotaxis protein CheW [Gammaproteobacteria bacterium]|nr:chemotaxis protein CheW [Gammaproteobacteria bacterium]MCZ6855724.1 chemotaxis protein CheW [Gammaproteobacteria bacterium]
MSDGQALNKLHEIKAATFQNAAPLPLLETTHSEWQGLGYQVGGVRLVSRMGEIDEILTVPRLAPLPVVKSWVLGVTNVRGRLMPVIDLHDYLGMTKTLPKSQWRVLVVDADNLVAGLLVEQSLGIQHFLEDSFEETTGEGIEPLKPYVRGAFRHGGRLFYETDLKSILRDERFFNVAEQGN